MPEYLTGEMDAIESAMACRWWGLKYAIPCHHDDATLPEIVKFHKLLDKDYRKDPSAPKAVILEPGERFTVGN